MEEPTIQNLLTAIRGFSNEVTVRALADKLGISYSTVSRCKNGLWPRSLTLGAMLSVLDECRGRFFDGDGQALAASVLAQYAAQGIGAEALGTLEEALAEGGYDTFVSALLAQASAKRNGQTVGGREVEAPTVTQAPAQQDASATQAAPTARDAPATPNVLTARTAISPATTAGVSIGDASEARPAPATAITGTRANDLVLALPLAAVLLMGLLNVSLADLFVWAMGHRAEFVGISLVIALLPAVCGVFVDSPLAWRTYKETHPDATFSPRAFARVAKFGDVQGMAAGAGRFNLTAAYLVHQPLCNLGSMMCYVALLAFLLDLPGFAGFFLEHEWIEYLKVAVVAAFLLSFGHMREQQKLPPADPEREPLRDNPDTFLPTRVHVWANMIHLVWTISLLIVLLMSYLIYSIVDFRTQSLPALVLWPYLQAILFYAHTCASPLAARLRTVSVGMLLPCIAATSAAFALSAAICYLPSWVSVVLGACGLLFTGLAHAWTRARARTEDSAHDWFEAGRSFGVYAVAMTATVLTLVLLGLFSFSVG